MKQPEQKLPRYVITAINRLTGERVPICSPHTEFQIRRMYDKLVGDPKRSTLYKPKAYKYPRVEIYREPEPGLWDQQPQVGHLRTAPPQKKAVFSVTAVNPYICSGKKRNGAI